jgi:F-type H+-transporting ATPase subunit b
MFASPEFWVFVAFVIFLGIFGKKAFLFLIKILDDHRDKVAQQLNEAQRLHNEAQSLLESYQEKHDEAVEQSKKIIAFAEAEAKEFKKSNQDEFDRFMTSKEKTLLDRIAVEKEEVISQLREQVLDEAIALVENLFAKDSKEKSKLTEASLKEISKLSLKPDKKIKDRF